MRSTFDFRRTLVAGVLASITFITSGTCATWMEKAVSPVANPLFFEDPHIRSEVRPLFMQHRIDDDFVVGGADVKVYAVQARWAVTDRLALIATKDGYVDVDLDGGGESDGFADISAGFKYALIKDEPGEFIVTAGSKIEFPTGNSDVFQGNGSGEWDFFLSSAKGIGDLRAMGSAGLRVPNDFDEETMQAHYGAQVDYYFCRWFVPFVSLNAFTTLSEGVSGLPDEGADLINFGSSSAQGDTLAVGGVGARARLLDNVELGFAYERGFGDHNFFDDRYTVDLIWRF